MHLKFDWVWLVVSPGFTLSSGLSMVVDNFMYWIFTLWFTLLRSVHTTLKLHFLVHFTLFSGMTILSLCFPWILLLVVHTSNSSKFFLKVYTSTRYSRRLNVTSMAFLTWSSLFKVTIWSSYLLILQSIKISVCVHQVWRHHLVQLSTDTSDYQHQRLCPPGMTSSSGPTFYWYVRLSTPVSVFTRHDVIIWSTFLLIRWSINTVVCVHQPWRHHLFPGQEDLCRLHPSR